MVHKMSTYQTNAIWAGIFFLAAIVTGISSAIFLPSIQDTTDDFASISANESKGSLVYYL